MVRGQWQKSPSWCETASLIARFMRQTWGPSGTDRTQVGPMLAPWTFLSWLSFNSFNSLQNGSWTMAKQSFMMWSSLSFNSFNFLWPSNTMWWYRSGSTLAKVVACYLKAPCHYLSQCWLLISQVLWYSPEGNFTWDAQDISSWYEFEYYYLGLQFHLSWTNEVHVI